MFVLCKPFLSVCVFLCCFVGAGFLTDCNFDSGECEWVQEKDDDLDWTVHYHENGDIKLINAQFIDIKNTFFWKIESSKFVPSLRGSQANMMTC